MMSAGECEGATQLQAKGLSVLHEAALQAWTTAIQMMEDEDDQVLPSVHSICNNIASILSASCTCMSLKGCFSISSRRCWQHFGLAGINTGFYILAMSIQHG